MVTVVLPCHNEAGNVARYAAELYPALDALGEAYEVVIVDDGSTDDTASVAQSLLMTRKDTRIVSVSPNRGMGGALRAGFSEAKGDWIVTLDADLTFPPSYIKELLTTARETGADLVSGSPYLRPGDMDGVPWIRRAPSLMINALYRGLFGFALTAYTPVFRLYRSSFLKNLDITSNGFEINAEIAARALLAKRKVAEIPTPLLTRTSGVSKLDRSRELRRHTALIARLLSNP